MPRRSYKAPTDRPPRPTPNERASVAQQPRTLVDKTGKRNIQKRNRQRKGFAREGDLAAGHPEPQNRLWSFPMLAESRPRERHSAWENTRLHRRRRRPATRNVQNGNARGAVNRAPDRISSALASSASPTRIRIETKPPIHAGLTHTPEYTLKAAIKLLIYIVQKRVCSTCVSGMFFFLCRLCYAGCRKTCLVA